ncbi:MAG: D-xylose 1-dehydrogenase Gfo6 [Haloarculaceae archaeon]
MELAIPTTFDRRDWARPVEGTPLRVAVVGLGDFARDVALPALDRSDHCEVTAVVSGSPETASAAAAEYGIERVLTYDEYEDGEAADGYDAVYLVTPNGLHLPQAETAAGLGKHVLCEKPIEASADRAERLVAACEDAGVELMSAYRMQTTRSVRWVREQVRAGVIGDPVQVHGEISFDLIADGDTDQWRLDGDLAGGGAFMDIGVYPLNTAAFVLDADPVAVRASARSDRPAFDEVEEHVDFQVEFDDGTVGSCTASYGAASANRLSVIGTDGRVVVEPVFGIDCERTVTVERDGSATSLDAAEPSEVVDELDYFATGVLGDLTVEPDGAEGVRDVRVAEAVYESAETGKRVEL